MRRSRDSQSGERVDGVASGPYRPFATSAENVRRQPILDGQSTGPQHRGNAQEAYFVEKLFLDRDLNC